MSITLSRRIRIFVLNKLKQNVYNHRLYLRNLSHEQERLDKVVTTIEEQQEQSVSKSNNFRNKLLNGPSLKDFFKNDHLANLENVPEDEVIPYLQFKNRCEVPRKVFFDIYGCQMNFSDAEIVWAILKQKKFERTRNIVEADIILIITCAIRDSAEERIWGRLHYLKGIKKSRKKDRPSLKIGLLGCMAERLKEQILEKSNQIVDIVAGPDSYKDLPRLLTLTENNQQSVNVLLSLDETYADITPVRLNENSISAYVSIMRGCDNMCTYCIVPFTRGRERSRPVSSILHEVERLSIEGVKEITLLGQNVNSYRDISNDNKLDNITSLAKGFKTVYKVKKGGLRFADLLKQVANINPEMRIRFTSPHPKDFPDEVIEAIQSYPNICKNLHMPAQSGNSAVLERMRRGYDREAYINLICHIRKYIPDVALSSDFICGFCGETEEEFNDTLTLMDEIRYNTAFLFAYSMREKTTAHRRFTDDVSVCIKQNRLEQMIRLFRQHALKLNRSQIGRIHLVLIEGYSRRSKSYFQGRNDNNIRVILPANELVPQKNGYEARNIKAGDYVAVYINEANSQILKGIPLYHTTIESFYMDNKYKENLSFMEI